MDTWLSFTILLMTILLALVQKRNHLAVKLYFRAQLIATLVLFFGVKYFGNNESLYTLLYVAVTLPILETCWFLISESGINDKMLLTALAFGTGVGCMASFGMTHFDVGAYVTFFEGVILAAVGMAMMLASPTSEDSLSVETIGILSMMLSSFDFGYVANEDWERINGWIPSLFCILAFSRIAGDGAKKWLTQR